VTYGTSHHSEAEGEGHHMMQMLMASMFSSNDQVDCTDAAAADT